MSSVYFSGGKSQGLTKTISITSGKGGVGKSSILANLAINLSKKGNKVLILDGDWGMANVDIMFGKKCPYSINDVLNHGMPIRDVMVNIYPGVDLIPGGQGVYELQRVDPHGKRFLMDQINELEGLYDYMLIDTAPGIDDNVLYLNAAAQEIVMILNPDPSSLADTYSLIKVLNKIYRESKFSILCNQVRDNDDGRRVFGRLDDVVSQFLCVNLKYIGSVPFDSELRAATKSQQLISVSRPMSVSARSIADISQKLCSFSGLRENKGGMQFFWEQMMGVA